MIDEERKNEAPAAEPDAPSQGPAAAPLPPPSPAGESAAGAIAPVSPVPDVPGAETPGADGGMLKERPEILVGAAFLGGLLVAAILRRRD